jgi:hypothetical protein
MNEEMNYKHDLNNRLMKTKILLSVILLTTLLSSCGSVRPTTINRNSEDDLKNYTYFFVNPAGVKSGGTGYVTGNNYGVFGATTTKSTDPIDIISGYLMKQGYVRVADIDDDISDKTLVISYGETGRRSLNLGYAIEITLQFTSAKTHTLVCTVTGEGQGETEADDVRIAITRCLDTAFGTTKDQTKSSSRQF